MTEGADGCFMSELKWLRAVGLSILQLDLVHTKPGVAVFSTGLFSLVEMLSCFQINNVIMYVFELLVGIVPLCSV